MRPPPGLAALAALVALVAAMGCSGDESASPASSTGSGGGAGAGGSGHGGDARTTVVPVESSELLANPGMGWQTFHDFADTDASLAGLPSGSAYFRWTWRDLEPNDGDIRTDAIADALDRARTAGQTLMFRVMLAGSDSEYAPDWLGATGCPIFAYQYDGGPVLHTPDLDDAVCRARHDALVEALGAAFASEPDVQVDVGSVGLWGEWHFSSTSPEVPMPSLATRRAIVDLYRATFPSSPQQALIGDVEALAYATGKGSGWRADCLGDYGLFSPTWNHMDDMYAQNVEAANAQDAWQRGPVAWESCATMQQWIDAGFDVHAAFQFALDLHGSFVNNKSAALPAGDAPRHEVEWLLGKLGYRLALRLLRHPATVAAGGKLDVGMTWENLGVAPPYHPFGLAVRLTPADVGLADPVVLPVAADVRTWLPGAATEVDEELQLPATLASGTWKLAVGITGTPGAPMLRLAIEGRDADGWYAIGTVEVE